MKWEDLIKLLKPGGVFLLLLEHFFQLCWSDRAHRATLIHSLLLRLKVRLTPPSYVFIRAPISCSWLQKWVNPQRVPYLNIHTYSRNRPVYSLLPKPVWVFMDGVKHIPTESKQQHRLYLVRLKEEHYFHVMWVRISHLDFRIWAILKLLFCFTNVNLMFSSLMS